MLTRFAIADPVTFYDQPCTVTQVLRDRDSGWAHQLYRVALPSGREVVAIDMELSIRHP